MASMRSLVFGAVLATKVLAAPADVESVVRRGPAAVPHQYAVNGYAAMGDTYATGAGDGGKLNSLGYGNCSLFDTSYPFQLLNDPRLEYGPSGGRDFYPTMCNSATASSISTQAGTIGSDSDMVTLTVGSNDVGFAGLLNACVFGFAPPNLDCDTANKQARKTIRSTNFFNSLNNAVLDIFAAAPAANIYVVAYPTFFNENTTQCDTACFKILGQACTSDLYLTTSRRKKVNNVVRLLNQVLLNVVKNNHGRDGSTIQFVPTDSLFTGHRFCEDGVTEPDYNNADGWFFPFTYYTTPSLDTFNPAICADSTSLFNAEIGDLFACGLYNSGANFQSSLAKSTKFSSTQFPNPKTSSGFNNAPDFFNRIFHPTIDGANAMHNAVMQRYN